MFIELDGNSLIVNTEEIAMVRLYLNPGKRFTMLKLKNETQPIWLSVEDYDVIRKGLKGKTDSNDLKVTEPIQRKVTPRGRGKQHDRDYHKSAHIPKPHVYEGIDSENNCIRCLLPLQHPCHNASNPIEVSNPNEPIIGEVNVNRPEETPTR